MHHNPPSGGFTLFRVSVSIVECWGGCPHGNLSRGCLTQQMQSSSPKDIHDLAAAAILFHARLDELKNTRRSPELEWYPYNSFGVFAVLTPMLQHERRDLLNLAGAAPVLDIGCGDGDFSFLFESLGCRVVPIDNPATNYNRTHGFQTLRAALGSSLDLAVSDVDAGLDLRGRTFGLALCLGVLYHLQNQSGFLE